MKTLLALALVLSGCGEGSELEPELEPEIRMTLQNVDCDGRWRFRIEAADRIWAASVPAGNLAELGRVPGKSLVTFSVENEFNNVTALPPLDLRTNLSAYFRWTCSTTIGALRITHGWDGLVYPRP